MGHDLVSFVEVITPSKGKKKKKKSMTQQCVVHIELSGQ